MPPETPAPIERIAARHAEIGGGITVDRALPYRHRRSIGAWCFLDHAGPARFEPGHGMHVGAHPHIGLQTFTWMIEGEALHRDSLGNVQPIRPGEVNLMTAGRGISHTEDSPPDQRTMHAAQLWIALPPGQEDMPPAFEHYPDLPRWQEGGATVTLLAGSLAGKTSPCRLFSPLVGADLAAAQPASVVLPLDPAFEHGVLTLQGETSLEGEAFGANELAYLPPGRSRLELSLSADTRALLIGGAPVAHEIVMWWNFVATDRARVVQAQRDWEAGHARFGSIAGREDSRLPAPPLPWAS